MRAIPLVLVLAVLAPPAQAAAQAPSVRAGKWLRVDFHARVQGDMRASQVPATDEDGAARERSEIGRRRIGIDGRAAGVLDYQVEYEIGAREWRDVYVDYRQFKPFQIRAGRFKVPFGLDENTSAANLDFIHRARISARLAPGRDRGVSAHGRVLGDRLIYHAGLFRNDGDNARPSASLRVYGARTVAARAIVRPFAGSKRAAADLQVGAAVAVSDVPLGFPAIRARTVFGEPFFASDVWVQGRRLRTGLEARWRPGRLALQSEDIRLTDERRGQSVEDGDLSPLLAHGWYASAAYAITRGRRWYGAIELAGRIETLTFGSTGTAGEPSSSRRADRVRGNADHAVTAGLNWQVNPWVRVQANLIRERIAEPAMGPSPGRPAFWSRALRVQVAI